MDFASKSPATFAQLSCTITTLAFYITVSDSKLFNITLIHTVLNYDGYFKEDKRRGGTSLKTNSTKSYLLNNK